MKFFNILIIKFGALGDVVRTSYFAKPLHDKVSKLGLQARIFWITSPLSVPLIRFNPYIDFISTRFSELQNIKFDEIYSLDDEDEIISEIKKLSFQNLIGAYSLSDGSKIYCDRSASWFDMGLLSRYGKDHADELKRMNTRTHSEIFREIFQVDFVDLNFYNSPYINTKIKNIINTISKNRFSIGLNAFAGNRWPAKSLIDSEFENLVAFLSSIKVFGEPVTIFLLGSGADLLKKQKFISSNSIFSNITTLDTDKNILELASVVKNLNLLVTADSLCLHLAVAQQVPTVAYFAPTSASEIENNITIRKVISMSQDYCSYKPNADNSTITSDRISKEVLTLLKIFTND